MAAPVPLGLKWLAFTGVMVPGTSVATRAQIAELMALHADEPLQAEIVPIALADVNLAPQVLDEGRATSRLRIKF